MLTRAATEETSNPARLLRLANSDIERARAARRYWGEAEVAATYLRFMRDGPEAPSTRETLRRSYIAAPFLRGSAPWRIRYAGSVWSLIDPVTRAAVIRETVWLARATNHTYSYARGLVANTPAATAVDAMLRSGDD